MDKIRKTSLVAVWASPARRTTLRWLSCALNVQIEFVKNLLGVMKCGMRGG